MLRIKKRKYGYKIYLYGFSAMVICSAGAIGTMAWTHSLRSQMTAMEAEKLTDTYRTTASTPPTKRSVSPNPTSEKRATPSGRVANVSATPTTSPSPTTDLVQAASNPMPTPTPTPTPSLSPATTPTATPTSDSAPDALLP